MCACVYIYIITGIQKTVTALGGTNTTIKNNNIAITGVH